MNAAGPTRHASCVVVGSAGVLILGPSGSGKSTLALRLIRSAERMGRLGRLVADDRVRFEAAGGRLIASAPPALASRVELRGWGLVGLLVLDAAVVRLVVEFVDGPERLPPASDLMIVIEGIALPRLPVAPRSEAAALLAYQALATVIAGGSCGSSALAFAAQHETLPIPALEAAPPSSGPAALGGARRPRSGAQ